jgi:AraC family transcriptional regulator
MIDVEVKTIEPETVAFVSMSGPYSQIPDAMGRLYGWIVQHGLQPAGMPSGVYLTPPDLTPKSDVRWELETALAGSPSPIAVDGSGCGVRNNPEMPVAYGMHRGPYETVGETYELLGRWVAANGYRLSGPPREVYLSDPEDTPPEEYLTEVRMPIARG